MLSEVKRFIRYEALIDRVPFSGCWIWLGPLTHDGYARVSVNGRKVGLHRFMFQKYVGHIPMGMQLDHVCNISCCVNPSHLRICTCKENVLRGNTISGNNFRKDVCKRGHPFDENNTYRMKGGGRACKACGRIKSLTWYHRNKTCHTK